MTDPDRQSDPAAARWMVIQVVRAVGVATVLAGLLHTAGRIPALADVPRWFGYVLVGVGFAEAFLLPQLLARRWRSPGP
jgi:hypothetical protein